MAFTAMILLAVLASSREILPCNALERIYTLSIYHGGPMRTAKLFQNGQSQAVRLPKEFRFEGDEVLIQRVGNAVVLLPKSRSWEVLIQSLDKFPADFMEDRAQPKDQPREDL